MREENLHSASLVQEQLKKYSNVAEEDYDVIGNDGKKIQLLDSHVTKKANRVRKNISLAPLLTTK